MDAAGHARFGGLVVGVDVGELVDMANSPNGAASWPTSPRRSSTTVSCSSAAKTLAGALP